MRLSPASGDSPVCTLCAKAELFGGVFRKYVVAERALRAFLVENSVGAKRSDWPHLFLTKTDPLTASEAVEWDCWSDLHSFIHTSYLVPVSAITDMPARYASFA